MRSPPPGSGGGGGAGDAMRADASVPADKEMIVARLKELGVDLDAYDLGTLFVDPPRCGLDAPTLKLAHGFETVVYMSCGPDTLAEPGGLGCVVERGRLGLYLIEASPPRRRTLVRDSW